MSEAGSSKSLSVLLGALRQERRDGELVLTQNDGVRKLYLSRGELVHLNSEVAGEKFGSYLLRQGILDFPALKLLLDNDRDQRIGTKVIEGGMMSAEARDQHLRSHQEQILINALEHPILDWTWSPDSLATRLGKDLHFDLQHRQFIWRTFQESNALAELVDILEAETDWRWEGRWDLLEALSDLPLTPSTAYALSFLTADPISFETFRSLSNLTGEEAARVIGTLWALGALVLSSGELPSADGPRIPVPLPLPEPAEAAPQEPDLRGPITQPEFLDLDPESSEPPATPAPSLMDLMEPADPVHPADLPPCGPRPRAADLPPCGPRPQAPPQPQAQFQPPLEPQPGPKDGPDPRYRVIELDEAPGREVERPSAPPPSAADLSPAGPRPEPRSQGLPEFPELARIAGMEYLSQEALSGPAKARKLLAQARHQVMLNRTIEAVRTLEAMVRLEMDDGAAFEAWLLLGRLRSVNPAWSSRAVLALESATRLRPKAAEPWALMGEIYHRKGFEPEAANCFRKALLLDPSQQIPADVDLTESPYPTLRAKPQGKGLLGTFRALLGRKD